MLELSTLEFAEDNKYHLFQMGQLVVYKDQTYWVVGMNLYLGYDFSLWKYSLAKPTHGNAVEQKPWKYSRMNIDYVADVKETDIRSLEAWSKAKKAALQQEIDKLQAQIEKLKEQQ